MSHYRAASITPRQTSTTDLYTYTFDGQLSFNKAYTGFPANTAVGSIVNPGITFNYGDGTTVALYMKVTSIDTINGLLIGTPVTSAGASLTHTYSSAAGIKDYVAFYQTSARVTTNDSFSGGSFRNQVTVNAGTTNHVPVASAPAVLQVADNTVFTYQLSASDQDGDALTYAIGTANQFITSTSSAATKVAPAGVTISSTGLLTWDVRDTGGAAVTPGQLYTMTLTVSDGKAATPLDFILQIVDTRTNQAPVFSYVAPPQYFQAGDVNAVEVRATDPNANLSSISVLNAPAGLTTVYHASEGELHLNFAAAAAGVYVVNVQAEDTAGLTTQTSITYTVTAPPLADINGSAAGTTATFVAVDGAAPGLLLPAAIVTDTAAHLSGAVFGISGTLPEDQIAIQSSGSVAASNGTITYGGTAIGTYSGGAGTDFRIVFNSAATQANVQDTLRHVTYADTATITTSHTLNATLVNSAGGSIGTAASFTGGATAIAVTDAGYSSPTLIDVNGDGALDIVVGTADGTIKTLLANGDGTFTQATGAQDPFAAISGLAHASLNRYDYNGDGKIDIVAGLADGTIQVLQNNGAGLPFTQVAAASNPFNGINAGADASTGFVDYDGDGKVDMVLGSASSHTLRAFHNTGSGFAEVTGAANPFNGIDPGTEAQPRFTDLDRDGLRDLVVGNGAGGFTAYHNNGAGSAFTALPAAGNPLAGITASSGNATMAFGDLDGDGNADLVLGQQDGSLRRYNSTSTTGEQIAVVHVDEAPTATFAAPGGATEQVPLDLKGKLSVADNDAGTGALTATVSATYGLLQIATGTSGATVTSGNGSAAVVVSGTVAQLNALFSTDGTSAISYTPDTDNPPAGATLTLLVNDNGNTGSGGPLTASVTQTVAITAVNDAPTATITGLTSAIEQTPYDLRGHLSVGDADAGTAVVTATVSADTGVITASVGDSGMQSLSGSGTGVVTVTGTLAQINALFATSGTGTVSYTNQSDTPPASTQVTLSINDGGNTGSGGALTGTRVATLAITPVNDAPSGTSATITTAEDTAHIFAGSEFGFTDVDGNTLQAVKITTLPAGSLTLAGAQVTVGQFVSAIDIAAGRLAFTPAQDANGDALTSFTFQVQDNGGTANGGADTDPSPKTITFNVSAVNDAPTATITGLGTAVEQTPYDLRGHLSVGDVDAGTGTVSATISVDSGVITMTQGDSGAGYIFGSGTGMVSVIGTLAQINALFSTSGTGTVTYVNDSDAPSASTKVTLTVSDAGNTGSGGALSATTSATLAIQAVNDAPTASVTGLTTATEQVAYDLKGHLSVADVDAGTGTVTATVGATYGVVTATAGDSGATVSGSGTASLTVTGTLAQVQALLNAGGTGTIAYTADTDTPPASATVTLNVNDGGNTGTGGALTASASQAIAITAVNDAPVFTASGANASYVENAAFVRVAPSVLLTDDNTSFGGGTLTVALTSGAAGGDVIGVLSSATAGQGIELSGTSVKYNGTVIGTVTANAAISSTVTFNAAATTAAISALAQAVAYTNTGDNPGAADRTFLFTLKDGGGTANGGADTTSFTRTVAVTPVNDAPMATIAAGTGPIVKAGGEILVSDNNTTYQINPVAAQLAGGGFVVAWEDQSGANGGSSSDIRAQVYTAAGARVGGELLVNTIVAGGQSVPAITALANGGFAVSWADFSGASGDNGNGDMRAQAFSATGAKVGGEVLVNTVVAGQQYNNQMVALSGGGYAVTWTDTGGTLGGASYDVHAQVIDAAGAKVGAELVVNTITASYQYAQSVTALSNGGFAVAWLDTSGASGDGGIGDIRAQIVSASGAKVGGELLVNATVTGNQNQTRIVGLANGGFAVTWVDASGASGDNGNGDIRAQVFTATGARNGEELLVNTTVTGSQGSQQVAALSNGNFVVTWSDASGANGGSGYDVRAQVVTATGAKVGGEVLVNTTVTGNQYSEQVTALANGGFAIQWFDTSTDSNGNVRSQQFAADGSKVGVEQLLNTTTAGQQFPGAIVAAGAGYVGVFADGSVSNTQAIRAQVFQPQGYQATEQVALDLKGKLSVADVDANGGVLTATVSASYGIVHLATGTSGATIVSGNDTGSVVVSGTLAQLNALLASDATSAVTYTADTDTPPASAILTLAVNDGGNTGTGGALGASTSTTIAITAVNDAPTAAFANPGTATEQVALNLKGSMSVADADAGTGVLTATVTADYGIVTATAGDSGASVSGSGGSTVIVRGTVAQINALLGSGGTGTIAYTASTDAPPSSATLTLGVNDGGNTGTGGALSGSAQQVVTIAGVNDAPTATLSGLGTATEQVAYNLKGHVAVGDVDAGTGIVSATLSAGFGVIHLEAGSSGATIAGGNDTGAVSVTGTVAQINALFGGNATSVAAYTANADAPPASTTLTLVVNDGGNTGSGGALSATATGTLALAIVNDAPVLGAPSAAAVTYTEDAAPVALFGGVTVSDPDQPASFTGGGFTIGTTGDGGIALSTDGKYVVVTGPKGDVTVRTADGTVVGDISGVGTVTVSVSNLTTAATPALVSDLVQHFTYATPNQAPSADDRTLTLTFSDGGNTGSGGALSATRTQVLHTVPVDDAPVAHADAFATPENAVSSGNLFADNGSGADSDVDGPALSIASARAGNTQLVIGQATTLASGAVLTVNADGTYRYDPNHAYDKLAAASSGASADNTTAHESFTYTLAGPAASPETKTATVSVTINGVDSDDTVTLTGSPNQTIDTGGGNDTVNGQAGTGDYSVHGGAGNDVIFTGFGADHVYGDAGNDTIETGAGNDYVDAGDGDDLVIGGAGEGDDYYEGGAGEDRIAYPSQTGGLVIDLREARRDTDTTLPADVHDRIQAVLAANGQPASATVGYAYGGAIGVDVLHGFEDATGGAGDDVIFGNELANRIDGGAGNDTISGGGGNDTLDGGAGVNTLYYGDLTNAVQVNLVEGTVNAGRQGGFDTVTNFQNVVLGAGNDQFIGDAGNNRIEGGAGNDTIDGGDGFDTAVYRGVLPADGIAVHSVGELIVTPGGGLGTDRLTNVEQLEFINGTDVVDIQIVGDNAVVFSRADTGAVAEQSTLSVSAAAGVLANDVNIDQRAGDQKVVAAVAHGSAAGTVGTALVGDYGSLTLNADGSYTYVADDRTNPLPAGTKVTDTFTYTADDGQAGDSTPTTLTITITGTNDVPVLGGRVRGGVVEDMGAHPSAGDTPSGTLTDSGQLTIADPDTGESAYQAQTTRGQYGTFTLGTTGGWTYSADDAQIAIQQLGEGRTLTDSFTATSRDGTASQPVTITLTGTNDQPVLTGGSIGSYTDTAAADSFQPIRGTIAQTVGTLSDRDIGDHYSYAVVGTPDATYGSFALAADGGYVFTPNDAAINALHAGSVTVTYQVEVNDGSGASNATSRATFTLTLSGANDPATVGGVTTGDVYEDGGAHDPATAMPTGQIAISGLLTVADRDSGEAVYRAETVQGSYGTFTLGTDGAWNYGADDAQAAIQRLGETQTLTERFTTTSLDGTASQDVVVTIHGINDQPVLTGGSLGTITDTSATDRFAALTGQIDHDTAPNAAGIVGNLADADATGTYSFALIGTPDTTYGTLSVNADGSYSFQPDNAAINALTGPVTLTYTVQVDDGSGTRNATNTAPFTLTLNGVQDAPVIGGTAAVSVTEDQNVTTTPAGQHLLVATGALTVSDADAGESHFQPGTTTGTYGTFAIMADGRYTYTADNDQAAIQSLAGGDHRTEMFAVRTVDGTTTSVTVTITGTNDVPVLGGRVTGAVSEDFGAHPQAGTAASANLTDSGMLTIADPDTGESSFQAGTFAGRYGTFTLTAGGTWSYAAANNQPAIQQLGEGRTLADSFTAVSRDGTASEAVVVTITGTNDQPVLTGGSIGSYTDTAAADTFAPLTGTIGQSVGTLADADVGDRYSYALTGTPDTTYGTLVVNADGSYVFTPNAAAINALHAGPVTLNYAVQVNDGSGATNATSSATFSLTLNGANDTAVVGGVTTGEVREDNGAHNPSSVAPSGTIATSGMLTVSDRDSGESSFQAGTSAGSYGTFTLGTDGAWSYSADDTQAAIQRLGEGETLTERFTATSKDGTASEAVTVTIRGTNDQPVLTGGSLGTITDTSATDRFAALTGQIDHDTAPNAAGIVGNLADADASGTYSFALLGTPDTTYGTLSVNADGSYVFTPNDAAINGLTGPLTLTYQVQVDDGSGTANAKATAAFTIQLNGTQDIAVIGGTTAVGVTEDRNVTTNANGTHVLTATGALTISDADAASDPQEATFAPDTQQGTYGTFTIGADGKYSYVADNDQVAIQRLGQGATLTETFYAVSHDGNSEQQITVTVTGTNDAPVVTSRLLDTTAANASLATATNIDGAFTLLPNRDTINATSVPHASIQGTTSAGAIDYYSFTVAKDGSVVTLDVDNVTEDTTLALYDANGRVVARNDDDGSDPGETNGVASFIRVTLAAGTYTVAIDHYPGLGNGQAANPLPAGTTYDLQVSVENHAVTNPYLHALTESDAALAVNGRVFAIDDVGDTDTFSHASGNSQITATGFTLTQAQTQAIEAGFSVDANGAYHFNLASPDYLDAGQRITAVFNVDVTDQLGAHTTQGVTVTIDGTLETGPAGTTGDDTLTGGNFGDLINGGDGDDIIRGLGGNDHLIGGAGDDMIDGGSGDDLIEGNDGDDRLAGGSGNDTIYGGAGNDIILGGSGDDLLIGGTGNNSLDGGDGFDTGVFAGRYADYTITQTGAHSYTLMHAVNGVTQVDTVTNVEAFRFDDGTYLFSTAGPDVIDASAKGDFTVQAGDGNDAIYLGAGFTAADRIDGGAGNDQAALQGNYTGANAVVLAAATLTNVETLALLPHAAGQPATGYSLTMNDGNVAAGQQMTIFAGNLGAGENLTFDGSAETDGSFQVFGGLGTDILTGSANNDGFFFGPGKYGPDDVVHGGGGDNDQLALDGNYTVTLDARADVEVVVLLPGPSDDRDHYTVTVADSFVGAGQTKTLYATGVVTSLSIDASAEQDGNLRILGGHAADTIHGGAGNDFIFGGEGGDTLFGGAGADTFSYYDAAQSSSTGFDTLADFDPSQDVISIEGHVKGAYSAVNGGGLSTATFDADLQAAVGSRLHGGDAVFYTPDSGDYAGQTFLIVNSDGTDGYQAGHDYVFHLPTGFATTGLGDFIVA